MIMVGNWVFALIYILVACAVHADESTIAHRRLSNDVCRSVLKTAEEVNSHNRSFIFRCRDGDDGGGVGDRLGGIMGGAFYAMLHDRTFRILWPGLERVFKPGHLNWTFDAPSLRIPYLDDKGVEIDHTRIRLNVPNSIFQAEPSRSDVGVVNDLNARLITQAENTTQIERFNHVYFHSNRGPNEEMYTALSKKHHWAAPSDNTEVNYSEAFRCVFESLFRPTDEFLHSTYKSVGREAVPFAHAVRVAEDPHFTSMAFHHRVDDGTAASNGDFNIVSDKAIMRIISIAEKHRVEGKKMNLFFITNSNASSHKIMHNTLIRKTFHSVYSQELLATIHINGAGKEAQVQSTLQAMRDWWIMRLVDILIGGSSGFSKSAALVAPADQIRYEDEGQAYRPNYWVMCGNRFC